MTMILKYLYLSLVLSIININVISIELDPNCQIPFLNKTCQTKLVFKKFENIQINSKIKMISKHYAKITSECEKRCNDQIKCFSFTWTINTCTIFPYVTQNNYESSTSELYIAICCGNQTTTGNFYKQ